jgi:hypothetical protein
VRFKKAGDFTQLLKAGVRPDAHSDDVDAKTFGALLQTHLEQIHSLQSPFQLIFRAAGHLKMEVVILTDLPKPGF